MILPGSSVRVEDPTSIYNGYQGFVQRISGQRAAVLFEGGTWDKLFTISMNPPSDLAVLAGPAPPRPPVVTPPGGMRPNTPH